ncbi:MAG TPA: hypothetical protein VHW00_00715 [Thermoanaerobaculia bacterium]|nr:hypothetical protein [Thermoanaerobaculia bacterium]
MKRWFLLSFCTLFLVIIAPHAQAQVDNNGDEGGCSAEFADPCWNPDDSDPTGCWWCWWQDPKPDCSKKPNNNCKECKAICDCEYSNAIADCDGEMCRRGALTERNACYGNCYADWLDVC